MSENSGLSVLFLLEAIMTQAKICTKCNRLLDSKVKVCPDCGGKVFKLVELLPSWMENSYAVYSS